MDEEKKNNSNVLARTEKSWGTRLVITDHVVLFEKFTRISHSQGSIKIYH